MPNTVTQTNIADDGRPPVHETRVETDNGASIRMRPPHVDDRGPLPAVTSVDAPHGQDIDTLFFSDTGNGVARIEGASRTGSPNARVISEREAIARFAQNVDIPPDAISRVNYTQNHGRVTGMSVVFAPDVDPEKLKAYNAAITNNLERKEIIPSGTNFDLNNNKAITAGNPDVVIAGPDGSVNAREINFGQAHNSTGQNFTVRMRADGTTEIAMGRELGRDGFRVTSQADRDAAEKIAKAVGGDVSSLDGKYKAVSVTVNKSAAEVLRDLEGKGLIAPGVTDNFHHMVAAGDVKVPAGHGPDAHVAAPKGTPVRARTGGVLATAAVAAGVFGVTMASGGSAANAAENAANAALPNAANLAGGNAAETGVRIGELAVGAATLGALALSAPVTITLGVVGTVGRDIAGLVFDGVSPGTFSQARTELRARSDERPQFEAMAKALARNVPREALDDPKHPLHTVAVAADSWSQAQERLATLDPNGPRQRQRLANARMSLAAAENGFIDAMHTTARDNPEAIKLMQNVAGVNPNQQTEAEFAASGNAATTPTNSDHASPPAVVAGANPGQQPTPDPAQSAKTAPRQAAGMTPT